MSNEPKRCQGRGFVDNKPVNGPSLPKLPPTSVISLLAVSRRHLYFGSSSVLFVPLSIALSVIDIVCNCKANPNMKNKN